MRHSFLLSPARPRGHPERHPSTRAENRFEQLGIALAEIELALPISVMLDQHVISYHVGREPANRKRLLSMLREKFGRITITKAISYCLGPDSAILEHQLRPEHLEQYCQNVVLP